MPVYGEYVLSEEEKMAAQLAVVSLAGLSNASALAAVCGVIETLSQRVPGGLDRVLDAILATVQDHRARKNGVN